MLKDESSFFYFIRLNTVNALAKIGDKDSIPALVETIKQDDIILMKNVIEGLISIDPSSAIPPLIEILKVYHF